MSAGAAPTRREPSLLVGTLNSSIDFDRSSTSALKSATLILTGGPLHSRRCTLGPTRSLSVNS